VAHHPRHLGPAQVQESRTHCTFPGHSSGIAAFHQESNERAAAPRSGYLSSEDARTGLSQPSTNSRLLQHWTTDLVRCITHEHHNPNWNGPGRLVQVALAAGLTFELAWLEYPATRGRERRLKNQGSAYRRCPLCRGTGGPLDPTAAAAAVLQAGGAR
jgi:hypothetical protein